MKQFASTAFAGVSMFAMASAAHANDISKNDTPQSDSFVQTYEAEYTTFDKNNGGFVDVNISAVGDTVYPSFKDCLVSDPSPLKDAVENTIAAVEGDTLWGPIRENKMGESCVSFGEATTNQAQAVKALDTDVVEKSGFSAVVHAVPKR
jgi:hypothetical protein